MGDERSDLSKLLQGTGLDPDVARAIAKAAKLRDRKTVEEKARSDLGAFAQLMLDLKPARHHRFICDHLMAVERGEIQRLAIFCPPGSAKSTYSSWLFPPWYLGRNPGKHIIGTSHTDDFSALWGRRARNMLISPHWPFPDVKLSADSRGAQFWSTNHDGSYYGVGVGGAVTGRRADLALIDDPVKSREQADSETARNRTWEWFLADLHTRLKPNAAIILIMCMTGDTPVMMADGRERPLRDIRPGDIVATMRDGRLSTAPVLNWINHGRDKVFSIKMTSGRTVKANARHPFLACIDGKPEWIRLRDLRPGHEIFRVSGESGRARHALGMGANCRSSAGDTAHRTTARSAASMAFGLLQQIQRASAIVASRIATALQPLTTIGCLLNNAACAQFAGSPPATTSERIGAGNSASIIARRREGFERFSATTAILLPDTSELLTPPICLPNTSDFTTEAIAEIWTAGDEDVFDVEIAETGNFIANSLITHNTRWHEDDLAGRILGPKYRGQSGEWFATDGRKWNVICLPQFAEENDPLGREYGETLWPEWYSKEHMEAERITQGPRNWGALYQQRPSPDSGTFFQRDRLRFYDPELPASKADKRAATVGMPALESLRIYGASDYGETGEGDYTVHGIVGVDPNDDMYVLDWFREKIDTFGAIENLLHLVGYWKPMKWAEDKSKVERSIEPFLIKRCSEQSIYFQREKFSTQAGKQQRAWSIQGRIAQGKVFFPRNRSWVGDLIDEMMQFPVGKHDDQVDVLSLFGRMLAGMRTKVVDFHEWRVVRGHEEKKSTSAYYKGRRR